MIRNYVMGMFIGVCGICMIFSFITNSISKKRRFALASMAFIAIILILANNVADGYNGDMRPKVNLIVKICKFIVYSFNLLIIFLFNIYLKDLFLNEGKAEDVPKSLKIVDYVIIVCEVFTVIIQFCVDGLHLLPMTIVSMSVLLYVFSILDTNRLIMKAHKQEVENLLEKQMMIAQTTSALVEAIDAKDNYTKGHSKRVAQYAMQIAEKAGKTPEECEEIFLIALLHDVGKIGIPDSIINKKTQLTVEEVEIIKTHTLIGKEILEKINISPSLSVGAYYHHERFDGKGYPLRLKGKEIPEIARIIAVADTYDAMASKRSYRDVLPQKVVRREIEKGIYTQFDPLFAKIMLELIDEDTEYHMRQN